jgi:CubicO group peptidase (beta-lactamase class C family)
MLNKQPNSHFEQLMSYAEHISSLSGASACALFVIQRDRVVAEYYSGTHGFNDSARKVGADSQFNVASVRKSYLGYAVAWALHDGDIYSIDDAVLNYLQLGEEEREALEGVTVRHLLTYTHGLGAEDGRSCVSLSPEQIGNTTGSELIFCKL